MEKRNAYTVVEFARRNGLCRSSVYNLARRGLIEIRKLGGRAVVLAEEERRFLAELPSYAPDPTRGFGHRKPKASKNRDAAK